MRSLKTLFSPAVPSQDAEAPRAGGLLRRLVRDRRAVAAVEFAFIAPVLLSLYFVTMEVAQGIETNKKVGRIGSMVADLITQQSSIDKSQVQAIMEIGGSILRPYARSEPEIVVTAIKITDEASPKVLVDWSRKMKDGVFSRPFTHDSTTTVPEKLKIAGTYLIRVQSKLDYRPVIAWSADQQTRLGLAGAFTHISMGETYYLRPRMSPDIPCGDCGS